MNKNLLVKKIVSLLRGELELYFKAAKDAHAEATHEQSKAENKYDTRGLEASYLARGQSIQARETELAIAAFDALHPKDFGPDDRIDICAYVEIEGKKERNSYFLGPRAGGTEVTHDKKEVLVITPQSPLGRELMGKKIGDKVKLEIGGTKSEYKIVTVA